MSIEYHQMRIRLPVKVRDRVEAEANSSNRSMNAEIVSRLEYSLFQEGIEEELIPAEMACELSKQSLKLLPSVILSRVVREINDGISLGHQRVRVDLTDFHLERMQEDARLPIMQNLEFKLKNSGYVVDWIGMTAVDIKFS